MKRTVCHVDLDLYAALFSDIAAWDSNLRADLERDLSRLRSTVATRGLSFVMIDMPEACRVLDKALSDGYINSSNLPNTFGKKLDRGTREFLSVLFELIFDGLGTIRGEVDPTSVFFLRQILVLAKKIKEDCSDAATNSEVDVFRKVDADLRGPDLDWECDTLNLEKAKELSFTDGFVAADTIAFAKDIVPRRLLCLLDQVTGQLFSQFPELDWRELHPRHGSGAVADLRTGSDKFLFPNWPNKLEGFFPHNYFAQSREDLHLEEEARYSVHEPPARLLAVPKTLKGPRLIASEPTCHQYAQQALMQWIRTYLPNSLRACIDFKSQSPSRKLCLEASRLGELATVDLSSASDRLSCWTVERALRTSPSLLRGLHAARTRWLVNATGVGERYFIKLKKFAAQGSAVTFPVQTMIYASMSIACLLFEWGARVNDRNIRKAARSIRIFGDDIIMPSYAVQTLTLLLSHCDLKVNVSKTHWKGYFRESCGMDAYAGVDVTPVYLQAFEFGSSPQDITSWVDVCNNVYTKGLWSLSDALVRKIPEKIRVLIPVSSEDLGVLTLRSFQPMSSTGKMRVSRHLHRLETLGLSPVVKAVRRRRENHLNLLQYFVERPSPETNWSSGYKVKDRFLLRKRWVMAKQP